MRKDLVMQATVTNDVSKKNVRNRFDVGFDVYHSAIDAARGWSWLGVCREGRNKEGVG